MLERTLNALFQQDQLAGKLDTLPPATIQFLMNWRGSEIQPHELLSHYCFRNAYSNTGERVICNVPDRFHCMEINCEYIREKR